jgi:hypothetical protein
MRTLVNTLQRLHSSTADSLLGGNTPGIRLFDVVGRDLGEARGSKKTIADGGFKDIEVKLGDNLQSQAHYISVSKGGNDALCIAYIGLTWPNGDKRAWYGDVGYSCGGSWYNSQTIVGENNYMPKCTWVDGDKSNGITTQGMGIHITDFVATEERAKAYADNMDTMCKSKPRFHLYDDLTSDMFLPYFDPPLEYDDNGVDKDNSKVFVDGASTGPLPPNKRKRRSQILKRHHFPGKLVTSAQAGHSARELCESGNSLGPDFVSQHEGLFCDMSEKELWPLCDADHTTGCFDTQNNTMVAGSLTRRDDATGRHIPEKDYSDVQAW